MFKRTHNRCIRCCQRERNARPSLGEINTILNKFNFSENKEERDTKQRF